MNRINLICLGVKDMKTSVKFYRDGLGFETAEKRDNPEIVFLILLVRNWSCIH